MTACKGGLPVRIKDINAKGINHALKYSWDQLETKVRRRHLKAGERDKQLALISGTTDFRGFAHRDLVIEAVFEDLALKQQMVADVEHNCAPHTILPPTPHLYLLATLRPMRRDLSRSLVCTSLVR